MALLLPVPLTLVGGGVIASSLLFQKAAGPHSDFILFSSLMVAFLLSVVTWPFGMALGPLGLALAFAGLISMSLECPRPHKDGFEEELVIRAMAFSLATGTFASLALLNWWRPLRVRTAILLTMLVLAMALVAAEVKISLPICTAEMAAIKPA